MSTIVLQAAGSAIGTFVGGPIGGTIGSALGAAAGAMLDQTLFATSSTRRIEGPRLKEMDGLSSSEGAPLPRLYGRAKLGGQMIWATRFEEQMVTTVRRAPRGGKGAPRQRVQETTYSYFANLAIALCEGPVSFVRRVWADGREVDLTRVTMRVHAGHEWQMPDPLIAAKEGYADAPAYRGVAYVVFERLALADYGNRIPQFTFEVVRAIPGVREAIRSVNLIPGSSEFAYNVGPVSRSMGVGAWASENRNQLQASTDVVASLDQLQALCPNLSSVNLVVSWFGDDLRVGSCTVAPRVDIAAKVTDTLTWDVAGLRRESARLVSFSGGKPAYGGTPTDLSVVALIGELRRRGLKVNLYPFIMMDIGPGMTLADPYGRPQQPPYPWRGRMTCDPAPGRPGSPDGSAAAGSQVAAFVGTVTPADITVTDGIFGCLKPDEWSFRRHILHYAKLAVAAGGVDGFMIGTEMVGLTRLRSASGVYPFAQALVALGNDVRTVLGGGTRITYAADWTEYGAHVLAGGQEVRFPLDPLWASPAIDAVGIDYYAPISDWRAGEGHTDAQEARSASDLAYLARRQRRGEAYDWFYPSDAARLAQARQPITDGAFGKPWMFRPKDLAGWWLNPHVERIAGQEVAATAWAPGLKPIWLTEIGCPAVDKGANSPNLFPDAKSSEGLFPPFSARTRDDLHQARFIEAQIGVFDPASPLFDPVTNPLKPGGTTRMIDPRDIAIWAWDARPFPSFPWFGNVWGDGANWFTGHWLNGRLEGAPLEALIRAVLADFGLASPANLAIDRMIDGYVLDRPMSAREAIEPLIRLFGLDAWMREGRLVVQERAARAPFAIAPEDLVPGRDGRAFEMLRAQESELPREVRFGFIDGDFEYRRAEGVARRLAGAAQREVSVSAAVVMPRTTAETQAEQLLRSRWAERETARFSLSPRAIGLEPGDTVLLPVAGQPRLFRITGIRDGETRSVTATSVERRGDPAPVRALPPVRTEPPPLPARPFARMLDLPVTREGADAVLLAVAATARPWGGALDVLRSSDGTSFAAATRILQPAMVGLTVTAIPAGAPWRFSRHAAFEFEAEVTGLQSVPDQAVLDGANLFAVAGPDDIWEILGIGRIEPVGPRRWRASRLLRGLAGSDRLAARVIGPGATLVGLDEAITPLVTGAGEIGRPLRWRIVPSGLDAADPAAIALDGSVPRTALKPHAPVHLRARRDGQGVRFSWVRRTRAGGDNWELAEVPLGETGEAYVLTIHLGGQPIQRITTSQPWHLYPLAQEATDFGGPQSTFDVSVAQLSADVGEGFVRRAVIRVG